MSHKTAATAVQTIGSDTGKNTLHLIGLDDKGPIVLREKIPAAGSQPGSPMCRGA
jgi:transposase